MTIINKIKAAINAAIIVFKNPYIFNKDVCDMTVKLLEFVTKVAEEESPYMTSFGLINLKTKEKTEIVSLWAGCGIGASPNKRIKELLEENYLLKEKLINN